MIRRRGTIPQELEDPEDIVVNQESFEDDDDDEEEDNGLVLPLPPPPTVAAPPVVVAGGMLHWKWIQQHLLEWPKELRNLLAGGLAGMVAKTIVAPLDRIKILYQVSNVPFHITKLPSVAHNIIQNEGLDALWKGNLATMIRVFPYSGIQFMTYDRIKGWFLRRHEQGQYFSMDHASVITSPSSGRKFGLTPLESLLAGMTAGTISVIFTYPLDLTRAQLAVLRKHKKCDPEYTPTKGFVQVLMDNYKVRGVPGLFRGITPTILGILPYSGIAFTLNEQGKREIHHVTGRDLTTIERMVTGAFAGLVAQTVTYPIEMTRRRMQTVGVLAANDTAFANLGGAAVSSASGASAATSVAASAATTTTTALPPPPTLSCTIRTLYAEQGMRGFFKGVSLNWMKGPIAFSISFTTYDTVQSLFMTEKERAARLPLRRRLTMASAHQPTVAVVVKAQSSSQQHQQQQSPSSHQQ